MAHPDGAPLTVDTTATICADRGRQLPENRFGNALAHGRAAGTGFGLSIVESIVHAHGWNMAVTDGIDGGARFDFTDVSVLT